MKSEHPERWKLLQAWRSGINRRVEEVRSGAVPRPFGFGQDELDFLPEPWSEDDPLIVQKMIQLGLDQSLLYEILVTLLGQLAPSTLESGADLQACARHLDRCPRRSACGRPGRQHHRGEAGGPRPEARAATPREVPGGMAAPVGGAQGREQQLGSRRSLHRQRATALGRRSAPGVHADGGDVRAAPEQRRPRRQLRRGRVRVRGGARHLRGSDPGRDLGADLGLRRRDGSVVRRDHRRRRADRGADGAAGLPRRGDRDPRRAEREHRGSRRARPRRDLRPRVCRCAGAAHQRGARGAAGVDGGSRPAARSTSSSSIAPRRCKSSTRRCSACPSSATTG
jgi:hypothetical protein